MPDLHALELFITCWRDKPGFLVDALGNATFLATVSHAPQEDERNEPVIVRIRCHGHDKGKVRIESKTGLQPVSRMDFSPPWAQYRFDDTDCALLVTSVGTAGASVVLRLRPA